MKIQCLVVSCASFYCWDPWPPEGCDIFLTWLRSHCFRSDTAIKCIREVIVSHSCVSKLKRVGIFTWKKMPLPVYELNENTVVTPATQWHNALKNGVTTVFNHSVNVNTEWDLQLLNFCMFLLFMFFNQWLLTWLNRFCLLISTGFSVHG